jgi:hypothetical protein
VLPSNESEADRTPIGSPPHRSSLTNKPTSDTSTFNCNTAANIAFVKLLRYILCNFTSILLSEPHLPLRVTRRCFPGIESPKARIERISISVPTCQNRKPYQHGFRVGAGRFIAGEERYVCAGFKA